MKKLFIAVWAVALAAFCIYEIAAHYGLAKAVVRQEMAKPIADVIDAQGRASRDCHFTDSHGKPAFDAERFFHTVSAIDTSLCPDDFAAAWLHYVETCRPLVGLHLPATWKQYNDAQQRSLEAVAICATKHGCRIQPL